MITYNFIINNWTVHCYFAVDCSCLNSIMEELWKLGCNSDLAKQAYDTIECGKLNRAFTYSNLHKKQTVLVIGECSSKSELINTMCHECGHILQHIAREGNLDRDGEEVCYLLGKLCLIIYDKYVSEKLL